MPPEIKKIRNIITLEEYRRNEKDYEYLFEIQLPPNDLKMFKVRFNFDLGNPLIGDLILDLEQEKMLEYHPFPEWVVQLKSPSKVLSKPYLIVPRLDKKIVRRITRKSIEEKFSVIESHLNNIGVEDLIAFEYDVGINILVPPFVPHFFISSKISKEKGGNPPYLQVFEPNMEHVAKNLKLKTTYFFELPFLVKV